MPQLCPQYIPFGWCVDRCIIMRVQTAVCLALALLLACGAPSLAQEDCSAAEQGWRNAEAQLTACQASTAEKDAAINAWSQALTASEAKVAELTAALKASQELDGLGLVSATAAYGARQANLVMSEMKIAADGLKKGDAVPLKEMFQKGVVTSVKTAKSAAGMASAALDTHVPSVRKACTDASGKVSALYKQHAAGLPAVQAAEKALSETNAKVVSAIGAHVKAQPALSDLDEPDTVQLLSYALLFLPLVVLLLPLCCFKGRR